MNLGAIQKMIDAGKLEGKGTLDHDALKAAGLARGGKDGVRLLGKGELTSKVSFKVAGASKGALEAVEKAGGKVEIIERVSSAEKAARQEGQGPRRTDRHQQGGDRGEEGLSASNLGEGLRQAHSSHYIGRRGTS